MAFASGAELETQMKITKRLNFALSNDYKLADNLLDEVMRMLNALIDS